MGPEAFCKWYGIRARDGVNFAHSSPYSTLLLLVVGRVLIIFWLLLSNTPTVSRLSLPNSNKIDRSLGGDTAGTDAANCPRGCLISHDFVLSNKSWGERGGRGAVFVVKVMLSKATATCTETLLARKSLDVTWWREVEKKSYFVLLLCTHLLSLNCLYLSPQFFLSYFLPLPCWGGGVRKQPAKVNPSHLLKKQVKPLESKYTPVTSLQAFCISGKTV